LIEIGAESGINFSGYGDGKKFFNGRPVDPFYDQPHLGVCSVRISVRALAHLPAAGATGLRFSRLITKSRLLDGILFFRIS
jgi:hypothetical protein